MLDKFKWVFNITGNTLEKHQWIGHSETKNIGNFCPFVNSTFTFIDNREKRARREDIDNNIDHATQKHNKSDKRDERRRHCFPPSTCPSFSVLPPLSSSQSRMDSLNNWDDFMIYISDECMDRGEYDKALALLKQELDKKTVLYGMARTLLRKCVCARDD